MISGPLFKISSHNQDIFVLNIFCLISEKFDQFWTVNKRLMECSEEESFKYIPYRIYQVCFSPYESFKNIPYRIIRYVSLHTGYLNIYLIELSGMFLSIRVI